MKRNLESILSLIIGIIFGVIYHGTITAHTEPEIVTKTEYVYIESEPEVIEVEKVVEKVVCLPSYEEFFRNFTEEDEWYLKDLAMREAEGEGVIGQCWVMYTALCRCEAFGHSIKDEWSSSVYTSMNRTGRTPNEDCLKAFELIREGWTPKPLYFRARDYHSFGTALCQVGNHYFSY